MKTEHNTEIHFSCSVNSSCLVFSMIFSKHVSLYIQKLIDFPENFPEYFKVHFVIQKGYLVGIGIDI